MWELTTSHRTLSLRLEQHGRAGNLLIACIVPEFIHGPTEWGDSHINISRGADGFIVTDERAGVEIRAGHVEVKENTKPLNAFTIRERLNTVDQISQQDVFNEIHFKRNAGKVTSAFATRTPAESPTAEASTLARAQGFTPPPDGWREVDRPTTLGIVTRILHRDLAYEAPLMAAADAERLAAAFLHLTPDAEYHFTNGSWDDPPVQMNAGPTRGPSWNPISSSTFDAGVICVGLNGCSILWVEDED
jgi:hypothetical protein